MSKAGRNAFAPYIPSEVRNRSPQGANHVDARERSIDAATDASKLLITLSTGALGVGLAVLNTEVGKSATLTPASANHKIAIAAALVVLVVSLGIGIWTQLAVTHVLSEAANEST